MKNSNYESFRVLTTHADTPQDDTRKISFWVNEQNIHALEKTGDLGQTWRMHRSHALVDNSVHDHALTTVTQLYTLAGESIEARAVLPDAVHSTLTHYPNN